MPQTSQGDIQYHITSCLVYKLREMARARCKEKLWLGNRLGIGFWAVSNCTVHHLLYTFFYCYYFNILHSFLVLSRYSALTSIHQFSLFSSNSLPHPTHLLASQPQTTAFQQLGIGWFSLQSADTSKATQFSPNPWAHSTTTLTHNPLKCPGLNFSDCLVSLL